MDNDYDKAARYGAKHLDDTGLLDWLIPRADVYWQFSGWLDTRTIPFPGSPDRVCDTVAALLVDEEPPSRWAIPIEFQLRPDRMMFGRLLEYLGRLWREQQPYRGKRGDYRVGGVVINLTGTGQGASRAFRLGQAGPRTELVVVERNLEVLDAVSILSDIDAGRITRALLMWVPLMRGANDPALIEEWKRLAAREKDARLRADYAGLALVFASLVHRSRVWKKGLQEWNMKQSKVVQQWKKEAREEGRIEGETKGRTEGRTEGRAEGRITTLRRNLLLTLERRLGSPLPDDIRSQVETQQDAAVLERWFDRSLDVASLDEVRSLLASTK